MFCSEIQRFFGQAFLGFGGFLRGASRKIADNQDSDFRPRGHWRKSADPIDESAKKRPLKIYYTLFLDVNEVVLPDVPKI